MNAFTDLALKAPFQHHSETSRAAAKSISSVSGRDRNRVLEYLRQHTEGATDEQLGDALGMQGNTLRPRRRELEQAKLIQDSGRYALTKSLRKATVWIQKQPPAAVSTSLQPS